MLKPMEFALLVGRTVKDFWSKPKFASDYAQRVIDGVVGGHPVLVARTIRQAEKAGKPFELDKLRVPRLHLDGGSYSTPLVPYAVEKSIGDNKSYLKILDTLLDNGASPDRVSDNHAAPVVVATAYGCTGAIERLGQRKADFWVLSSLGATLLELARSRGGSEISRTEISLLKAAGPGGLPAVPLEDMKRHCVPERHVWRLDEQGNRMKGAFVKNCVSPKPATVTEIITPKIRAALNGTGKPGPLFGPGTPPPGAKPAKVLSFKRREATGQTRSQGK
jgi:hypothetical protein